MNAQLQTLFATIEQKKAEILNDVQRMSEEDFTRQPAPNQWSMSQVLAHLQTSEMLSTLYMLKKFQGIETYSDTGIQHELLMLLVKLSQRLPLRYKAPTVVASKTPSYNTKQELIANWQKSREALRSLLEKFQDHQLKKKVYRHPVAGLINIQHALIFFHEHLIHHTPQIKRLLREAER